MRSGFVAFCGLMVFAAGLRGQVSLSVGTYTQNFNGIGSGLPSGWSTYTSSTVSTLGTAGIFTATTTAWSGTTLGTDFRNVSSDDVAISATSAVQAANPNRAFGWRPVGTSAAEVAPARNGSVVLTISNTTGLFLTAISARVFSGNSVSGDQAYVLEYRVGSSGDFTQLASYTTGAPFNSIAISSGSSALTALGNNSNPISLRFRGTATSGASSLDTFAIDDFSITAVEAASIGSPPSNQTATVGDNVTFAVSATGTGTLIYQWRKGGTNITGNASANTATLTLPSITSSAAGTYDVVVTDDYGSVASPAATLTVTKAAATVTLGSLSATYNGSPHAATATTNPVGRTVTFTYDGSATAPTNAGSYSVVGTIDDPDYQGSATGTLTIAKATGSITFGSLSTVYTGSPRLATATTTPTGLSLVFTYDGSSTAPTNVGSYALVAAIDNANYQGSASATFAITPGAQTITFPAIADHSSSDAAFAISATSSSGLPVTFSLVAGAGTIANLAGNTITLAGGTGPVTVRASQGGGGNFAAATAVDRTFEVVTELQAPRITLQADGFQGHVRDSFTLTAAAIGSPMPTYQWRKNEAIVAGATSPTLYVASATVEDTGLYVFTATNSVGTAVAVPVGVVITKRPQTLTFTAPTGALPAGRPVTVNAGASSPLPVSLTIVSGLGSLNGNVLTGQTGDVVVRATQPGNEVYAAATPVERTFSFVEGATAPVFILTPADQTGDAGASVSLRSAAIGTPTPAYQWSKDDVPLVGATGTSLTLTNLKLSDAGRYNVTATNGAGSVTAAASVVVRTAPIIVAPPVDVTVFAGTSATFNVVANGVPAPTFQWRRNGVAISGATTATFTLPAAVTDDAGSYDVVATNALGSVTSNAATLTVRQRDFSGNYFGRFVGATGDFALHVRADRTAVFLGYLPGLQTGFAAFDLTVDLLGNFTVSGMTAASSAVAHSTGAEATPAVAAEAQSITLRGALDEDSGSISGTLSGTTIALDGRRAARTGPASAIAGLYSAAQPGTADHRGYAIVAADGQVYVLLAAGTTFDSATGTIGMDGRVVTVSASQAGLDFGFSSGALIGTVRTTAGATTMFVGVLDAVAGREHLSNLSFRTGAGTGAFTPITGFVIGGTAAKQVLIRGAGPALANAPFNLTGVLPDPMLRLYRGSTIISQNDNWGTPAASGTAIASAATRVGAFPFRSGSADAALLSTLAPGAYSVVLLGSGATSSGATVVEVYEVPEENESPGARRLLNLSARGVVSATNPVIAGFVITGPAPQRVLVRGIGPGMSPFGPFTFPLLANPQLTLFRGNTVVKTNDDWFRDADATLIREAAAKTGAFALGAQSLDAAMLLYLEPGNYSVQVTAPAGATGTNASGVALVEVYEVRPSNP